MPVKPPNIFKGLDEGEWTRFAQQTAAQLARLLARLDGGGGIPSSVGASAQARAVHAALGAVAGLSRGYLRVAAEASAAEIGMLRASMSLLLSEMGGVIGSAGEHVMAGVRVPPGLDLDAFRPPPTLIPAVLSTTQRGIIAGASQVAAEIPGKVAEVVRSHVVAGQGVQNTARAIRDQVGFTYARSIVIARTQTIDAFNAVSRGSYMASGLEFYEWHATLGPRTCAICQVLDGQVFHVGHAPDPHHQCRCTLLPVIGRPSIDSQGYSMIPRVGGSIPSAVANTAAHRAAVKSALPSTWDLPADLRSLVVWQDNPDWRPSARLLKPGTTAPGIVRRLA
jgi:SPP1 gp7 family putative phage head morphogenesis protein